MTKKSGTLKWFSVEKGYGFVFSEEGDVQIHAASVCSREVYVTSFKHRTLNGNASITIEYVMASTPKGLRATWWRPL